MRQGAFHSGPRAHRPGRGRLALLAGLLALTGCTTGADQPEPAASPTAERTETPAPTATPVPTAEPLIAPVRPPEMDQADEAGAIATAEYVLLVAHYAATSGDVSEWDRLSTSDCGFCANIRDSVTEVYESGGRLEGGEFRLGEGTVVATDPSMSIYAVDIPYENAAVDEYDSTGSLVTTEPSGDGIFTLEVVPTPTGWRLLGAAARAADSQ